MGQETEKQRTYILICKPKQRNERRERERDSESSEVLKTFANSKSNQRDVLPPRRPRPQAVIPIEDKIFHLSELVGDILSQTTTAA